MYIYIYMYVGKNYYNKKTDLHKVWLLYLSLNVYNRECDFTKSYFILLEFDSSVQLSEKFHRYKQS